MVIIVDKRIPEAALKTLEKHGDIAKIESSEITYPAVSGHPDIFICKIKDKLIIAPNAPKDIINFLQASKISFAKGFKTIGKKYPQTAHYNALVTDKFLIHNLNYTDQKILELSNDLEKIDVKQAYTRCSVFALPDDRFITSDKGIEKVLLKRGLEVLFVNPNGVLLTGFKHGFFGGTAGVLEDKIFFIGNLDYLDEGEKVRGFLSDFEIIELYQGPLFDGGSLIFID